MVFQTLTLLLALTLAAAEAQEFVHGDECLFCHRNNIGVTWQKNSLLLGWTSTYYDSYYQYAAPGGPYSQRFGVYTFYTGAQGGTTIPSQTYHDFFGSYVFAKRREAAGSSWAAKHLTPKALLSGVTVQAGVKNVFDKVAPFDAFYSPYYYSPYGNVRLRSYWLSVKKEF